VRRARRRGVIAVVAGAVLFVVAGSMGLWLIVLMLCSVAASVTRHRLLARRGLPARLAAWAVHAPCGPSTPAALEHAIAVDLAAISRGHMDVLERAQVALGDAVDDPWRRGLGEERLAAARRLVADGRLVGITPRRQSGAARLRRSAVAVAMIVVLAVGALSQSRWWLVPMAVAGALFTLECVGLYEQRRGLPELLASRSVRDSIQALFVMPEPAVARSLVVLANNDAVVIRRARSLLEGDGQHAHARRRLLEAERLLVGGNRASPGNVLGGWMLAVTLPATATTTSPWWSGIP
jgi:hypothetical protein